MLLHNLKGNCFKPRKGFRGGPDMISYCSSFIFDDWLWRSSIHYIWLSTRQTDK